MMERVELNTKKIFRVLGFPEMGEILEEANEVYEKISAEAFEVALPTAVYAIVPNDDKEQWRGEPLKNCDYICYGLVSIGGEISQRASAYLDDGEYLDGMFLDAVADEIITKVGEQLVNRLMQELSEKSLGNTRRYTPGQHLPLSYQAEVIKHVEGQKFGISTTASHMINPVKSSSFIIGVSKDLAPTSIYHNCHQCPQKDCKWKDREDCEENGHE